MSDILQKQYVIRDHISTTSKRNIYKLHTISIGQRLLSLLSGKSPKVDKWETVPNDDRMAHRLYELIKNQEQVYITKEAAEGISQPYYDKFGIGIHLTPDPKSKAPEDTDKIKNIRRKNSDGWYANINTYKVDIVFVSPVDESIVKTVPEKDTEKTLMPGSAPESMPDPTTWK